MARIRTVKPAFFRHRKLFDLELSTGFPCRVAFAGLWTAADREGRFRWRPEELKLDCLPFDVVDFAAVLDALSRGGFILRYEVEGRAYGCIPSWNEHQSINQREAASVFPDANECAHMHAPVEGKGREGKGIGREEESTEALTRSAPDSPVLLLFPTVGNGAREWRLRRAQVDEWAAAYPNLDVLAECRKALAWLNANPGRRKTFRGMPQFLVNWCNRSVDSGRGSQRLAPVTGAVGSRTAALQVASERFLAGGGKS